MARKLAELHALKYAATGFTTAMHGVAVPEGAGA